MLGLLACSREQPVDTQPRGAAPTPVERAPGDASRGRRIFVDGISPDGGKIEAVLAGDVVADAKTIPCIGCHGEDGRGRPEGGMLPSNITWEALSKPYGGRSASGREHAAYDRAGLRKAITLGVDPSGNELQRTMPRYRMSSRDLDDLDAYLQVLGEPWAIGVAEASIALLTVLPADDATADAVAAVLSAYLTEVNTRGGVFGRKLELELLRLPSGEPVERQRQRLEATLTARPPFAVLAPRLGDAEAMLLAPLERDGIPVLGPVSSFPDPGTPPRRSVFHVEGGIPAQALALAEFAAGTQLPTQPPAQPPAHAVVIHGAHEPERSLAERVVATWTAAGLDAHTLALEEPVDASAIVERISSLDAEILLWLGPATAVAPTLGLLVGSEPAPVVLLPGALAFGDPFALPLALDGKLFLAYPWVPEDVTPAALRDYEALVAAHGLTPTARPAQLAALTAATILVEGLARSGRGVTRASFIDTLERLQEFQTGLTPAISFGPNQRVGVHDMRIVRVDLAAARLELVAPR